MKPFAESDALHARARAFVDAFERGEAMPESFDALACDLARFQAKHVPGYARLCAAEGVDPSKLERAADAPAVPTEVFKIARVAAFPESEACLTFRTSGTTMGDRGVHEMRTTQTYDFGALAFGRWALASDVTAPLVLSLTPSPEKVRDSSLFHMIEVFRRAMGGDGGYAIDGDVIDLAWLDEQVARAIGRDRPVLLCATSFALVHLLDALAGAAFPLPKGSRVMHTGGFKGKVREVDPVALRRDVAHVLGIPERMVACEYGMTELSSQFYEATIREPGAPHGVYVEPPWARVVPVHPETLEPVKNGEEGLARIEDLLNVDSAFAVLTRDRVMRVGPAGFVLLGRQTGADPRGCSIAIEEMMG
jgi:hypothetical protein